MGDESGLQIMMATLDKPLVFKRSNEGYMEISIGEHVYANYGVQMLPYELVDAYAHLRAQLLLEADRIDRQQSSSSFILKQG